MSEGSHKSNWSSLVKATGGEFERWVKWEGGLIGPHERVR